MERKNIREFSQIRRVLEHIYQYGFYTREDFINTKLVGSPRSYDDIVRQLRDLYFLDDGPSVLEEARRGKYKCYRFKRDYFGETGECLTAPFGLFSIKESSAEKILCCLSLSSRGVTVAEAVPACWNANDSDYDGSDCGPTVRRRFASLSEAGYVVKRETRYWLNDMLQELSDRELVRLYYLAVFYAGAGFPRVAAAFLQKSLLRQIIFRGLPEPPQAFLFRDNTYGNLFDEQLVYQLLQCCKDHTEVDLTVLRQSGPKRVQPVALRIDTKLGRWYLLSGQEDGPVRKVSNIQKVQRTKDCFPYDQVAEQVKTDLQYNYISGKMCDEPVLVEAELCFEDSSLRRQFEREILLGQIEGRDGREYYCVKLNDPVEIKPFLRCYGAFLRIVPSEQHNLDEELQEEYERMLEQYGSLQ